MPRLFKSVSSLLLSFSATILFAKDPLQSAMNEAYLLPAKKIIKESVKKKKARPVASGLDFSFIEDGKGRHKRNLSTLEASSVLPGEFTTKRAKTSVQASPILSGLPPQVKIRQRYLLDRVNPTSKDGVLKELLEIAKSYPGNWESFEGVAQFYLKIGEKEKALKSFSKSLSLGAPRSVGEALLRLQGSMNQSKSTSSEL